VSEHLQRALRDRDYATVMEILPDLIESGEGALFTVDSLAAALERGLPLFFNEPSDARTIAAIAIIQAAKEAERE